MIQLLADAGGTKSEWLLLKGEQVLQRFATQGIHPVLQSPEEINHIISSEVLPQLHLSPQAPIAEVFFYGAGCRPDLCHIVEKAIASVFPHCAIVVNTDMLGAARCLSKGEAAIVSILGTGSNSCLFDGHHIVDSISPLGFILGDEGSGASLGKRLVGDVVKQQMSKSLANLFFDETQLTVSSIIQSVYREPQPNRFLAQLTHFLYRHRNHPEINALITTEFENFFRRNIEPYNSPQLPMHFVGSIAWYFADELRDVAVRLGYRIERIHQKPFDALVHDGE